LKKLLLHKPIIIRNGYIIPSFYPLLAILIAMEAHHVGGHNLDEGVERRASQQEQHDGLVFTSVGDTGG
jgi:hypothetical protein